MTRQHATMTRIHPLVTGVAVMCGLDARELVGPRRDSQVSNARAIAAHLLAARGIGPTEIGRMLNMHWSSVITARGRMARDSALSAQAAAVHGELVAMASMAVMG